MLKIISANKNVRFIENRSIIQKDSHICSNVFFVTSLLYSHSCVNDLHKEPCFYFEPMLLSKVKQMEVLLPMVPCTSGEEHK
ncbi:hypothetical protein J5S49_00705 [Virgibacillus halodenitrificans]|uniref:hypothetical protein n=1 Tax=Virgibacillus halodenitrificans TaxID=1482 RepID=UPI00045C7694|nr:hypothetical protein [Virgibacillus halodenitrificans]MCG1026806.1 hypothetical protein [Virgibacillus halodenitrificans]CDQ30874.1 hypothetical protein BN993_00238 [Virgibacillus halodenitrificans]